MDPTIPNSTVSSTVTTSSSSTVSSQGTTPFQILEVSIISAQDLAPVTKSMHTYAITWIDPSRKLKTLTDQNGHTNPTWNQKLAFRVDNKILLSEDKTVTVEIYTTSWLRDVLVGTVSVLMSDLITPSARIAHNYPKNTRFVALQVRRPSGNPQGMLNMGIALLDNTMRSMPLHSCVNDSSDENSNSEIEKKGNYLHLEKQEEDDNGEINSKVQLWRSLSLGSEVNNEDFPPKGGSVVNGSMVNGSELSSDIGPSASVVAAEMAMKKQPLPAVPRPSNCQRKYADETGSSILEELTIEEATAKGFKLTSTRDKWRKQLSMKRNQKNSGDISELSGSRRHSRRNSDGGLFSCFGNAYGIEFTIVCGANNHGSGKNINSGSRSRIKKPSSKANSA